MPLGPMGGFPQYGMPRPAPIAAKPQFDYARPMPAGPPQPQSPAPPARPAYMPPQQQAAQPAPRIMLPAPRPPGYAPPYGQAMAPDYYGRPPPSQPAPHWGQPPAQQQYQQPPPAASAPTPQASQAPPHSAAASAPSAPAPQPENPRPPEPAQGYAPASDVPVKKEAQTAPEQSPGGSVASPHPDSDEGKPRSRKRPREGETGGSFLGGRSKDGDGNDGGKGGEGSRRRKGLPIPVKNDPKLENVPEGVAVIDFGTLLYVPPAPDLSNAGDLRLNTIPRFISSQLYSVVRVAVPAEFLTVRGPAVRKKCIWGTEIYTDDSDPLAGWYRPPDAPPVTVAPADPENDEGKASQAAAPADTAARDKEAGSVAGPDKELENEESKLGVEAESGDKAGSGEDKDMADGDAGSKAQTSYSMPAKPADQATTALEPSEETPGGTWKAPPPRVPFSGAIDESTKLPDHDLLITLRILPQLVRYTGSLRCGLVSRGWGAGHDGNSIRVIECEKIACGDAVKMAKHSMRKAAPVLGASHDDSDGYLMVMEQREASGDLQTFINYSPATLNFWPPFLLRIMYQQVDNQNPPSPPADPSQAERLKKWEAEWKTLVGDWEGAPDCLLFLEASEACP
ncbi:hypothetical protein DFJ74DRAFT_640183 [Hyaloraphidium curvatum]|nr:hypothetical protein DFJ74DRAFT_640183 [Hyaloraphidium curvatum]